MRSGRRAGIREKEGRGAVRQGIPEGEEKERRGGEAGIRQGEGEAGGGRAAVCLTILAPGTHTWFAAYATRPCSSGLIAASRLPSSLTSRTLRAVSKYCRSSWRSCSRSGRDGGEIEGG